LLERILLMTTDEGDTVLDPFSGTGTTAIAAKRLGRNYVGFEVDENYVVISRDKLSRTLPISKIGNIWVSFYLDEIITIRDMDWNELSNDFVVPNENRSIEHSKVFLKSTCKKPHKDSLLISNRESHLECQTELFK